MFRKNSSKYLQRPKLKYRSTTSSKQQTNVNINSKNITTHKQRLIPLTSELMANNLSSYCLTDKEFLEPLSNLIKAEVTNRINEIKENFACKSDFHHIRELVANQLFTNTNFAVSDNDVTENQTSISNFDVIDNDDIGNTRNILPLEIMYPDNNKDDLITNIKSIIPNRDYNQFTIQKMKEVDLRLKALETKMDQIQTTLNDIHIMNRNEIESLRCEQITKINALNQEISTLQLDFETLNDDHGFESKLQDIEDKVKQSLYETNQNMKQQYVGNDDNDNDKKNKYDEMFYELRQLKMNELYYKKSKRSLYLNQRPHINQFGPPPPFISEDNRKELLTPRFVESYVE